MADAAESRARHDLAEAYRRVGALKLNELASGNLSCRFADGMLISPTGATPEAITPEGLVFVDANGEWEGGSRPSSEWRMHAAIYRARAEAHAVVHTHSDSCVAVSSFHKPLPGFHYLVGLFGGSDVPCAPYYTFGSQALAEAAADALKDRSACLLGSHGMICRGATLNGAIVLAQRLEVLCRQYLLARHIGEPYTLTAAEWDDFFARARITRYGA